MDLNLVVLRKALENIDKDPDITFNHITAVSKVYNLKKIMIGEIEPTPGTWTKLHRAFPHLIPEPEFIVEGARYNRMSQKRSSGNQAGGDITINGQASGLSVEQQMLIKLLNEKDKDGSICRQMIAELLQK